MFRFPIPLTASALPGAWKWVDRKRRRAKRCMVTEAVVAPVSGLLLVFLALVLTYGAVLVFNHPVLQPYLALFAPVTQLWLKASAPLAALGQSLWPLPQPWNILVYWAVVMVAVPLAAAVLCTVLVRLLYHPFRAKLPQGTAVQQTEALLQQAKLAAGYAQRRSALAHARIAMLYCYAEFAFVLGFFYVYLKDNVTGDLIEYWTDHLYLLAIGACILTYCFAMYWIVWLVYDYFRILTIPLYFCRFPHKVIPEIERFAATLSAAAPSVVEKDPADLPVADRDDELRDGFKQGSIGKETEEQRSQPV